MIGKVFLLIFINYWAVCTALASPSLPNNFAFWEREVLNENEEKIEVLNIDKIYNVPFITTGSCGKSPEQWLIHDLNIFKNKDKALFKKIKWYKRKGYELSALSLSYLSKVEYITVLESKYSKFCREKGSTVFGTVYVIQIEKEGLIHDIILIDHLE